MNLGRLALKNLGRYPWRTGIRVFGLALTTATMMVWGAITGGFTRILHDSATGLELGDFQLHADGYRENQDIYRSLPQVQSLAERIESIGFKASPRLYGFALAAADQLSAGVRVIGLDPEREATVTRLHEHIARGEWLDTSKPRGVVLGGVLAKSLGVSPGSEIVLMGYATDGSLANDVFEVRGILASVTADIDNRGIYVLEPTFREFFLLTSGGHELAIAQADVSNSLDEARWQLEQLRLPGELKTWRELKPFLARTIDLQAITAYFTLAFTYLALGGLVLNLTFMRVYDHMREYGVMQAVGMLPGQIFTLIVSETFFLAALSATGAVIIGLPIGLWLQAVGIDFSWIIDRLAFAGLTIEPILHPVVGLKQVLAPLLFLLVSMPCFSLYPAIEAANMAPLKAMHRL